MEREAWRRGRGERREVKGSASLDIMLFLSRVSCGEPASGIVLSAECGVVWVRREAIV